MSYIEVTQKGWFERLRESIQGIVVGLFLFLIAFPLLFWNEGRAVHRAQSLAEGRGAVVSASADRLDPKLEGKLVHLTGLATTTQTLTDSVFPGVTAHEALKLRRSVEMYQWEEKAESRKRKKLGGGEETTTTYTYAKVWSERAIDSSRFKESGHSNPGSLPLAGAEQTADATLGVYRLGSLLNQLNSWEALGVPEEAATGDYEVSGSSLYRGRDSSNPRIGDVRVNFQVIHPTQVSVLAVVSGANLNPYTARAGGSTIYELRAGQHTADSMLTALESQNSLLTWFLRCLGCFLMAGGLSMMMRPLSVVADVIPFVGDLVEFGTGLVAVAVATPLALITMALGWLVYRPVLGVGLLVLAAGAVALGLKAWQGRAPRR